MPKMIAPTEMWFHERLLHDRAMHFTTALEASLL